MLLGELLEEGADHVAIDNEKAAQATEHLIGLGRRNILAVGSVEAPGLGTAEARTRGYLAALAEAGIPHRPEAMLPVDDFRMPDGARAVAGVLRAGERPDALLCLNDQLALGALRSLYESGLRVPEDVAVIGFDADDLGGTPEPGAVGRGWARRGPDSPTKSVDVVPGPDRADQRCATHRPRTSVHVPRPARLPVPKPLTSIDEEGGSAKVPAHVGGRVPQQGSPCRESSPDSR